MKKTIYILTALLLGLFSCNTAEFEQVEPKAAEETGLVAVTMQIQVPVTLNASTRALGDRDSIPSIKAIKVALFGISGYPQTYALAEPVDASGASVSDYATTNHKDGTTTDIYYFKVLLPVYEGKAHVHIIANGDESIKFLDETENSLMSKMSTTGNVGAYWARVVLEDGILPQKDQNGIMQTDNQGNFIPSDETADKFKNLQLVRNFAEVKLINDAADLHDVSWTLLNIPTKGSVAPMAAGTWVDDFWSYTYNKDNGKMYSNDGKVYDPFLFEDDPMDYTCPTKEEWPSAASETNYRYAFSNADGESVSFMYERPHPGSNKATCLMLRAKYKNDTEYSFYRIDLMNEDQGGYVPIYRNYRYQIRIFRVGNRGAKTPEEANLRDSGGNVSQTQEAQSLTDISDGYSRLYVEYIEKDFTSGGKKTLWVKYVPNVKTGTVDNSSIEVTVKTQGQALKAGSVPTKIGETLDGANIYQFEVNEQADSVDLVSVLSVTADNGETDITKKSKLFREITLRVLKKMDMKLALVPKKVTGLGDVTVLVDTLPKDLPGSMFPLILYIEDINHTLNPTQKDDTNGKDITIPVQTGKSLADGTTNSFYFIRTVNWSEYDPEQGGSNIVKTQFKTINGASATTIYVANEYFNTQSINLLNDGMYVNPVNKTVDFNVTKVEIEVEFDEGATNKSWTVEAGNGVTIKDKDGNTVTGGTGNATFYMTFPVNDTTADVTRTATVTSNGVDHNIEIIQKALEFTITPDTQDVDFFATTANVTVHAEEGVSWYASVSGGATITGAATDGRYWGEGTQTITVNFDANDGAQRPFTVTAEMTEPYERTSTADIVQKMVPAGEATFSVSSFTYNGNSRTGSGTSADGYVSIRLNNIGNTDRRGDWTTPNSYIQMGYSHYVQEGWDYTLVNERGGITITPGNGIKITGITITYSSATYAGYDFGNTSSVTVSTGSYNRTGTNSSGEWTGSSTDPIIFTNGYQNDYNGYSFPRITSIVVTYKAE